MPESTVRVFWYSQTGHSYACALRAAEVLRQGGRAVELVPLALAGPRDFQADQLLFCFPVNNFKVPVPFERRLRELPVDGGGREAFAIVTHAGIPASTAALFARLLAGKGLRLRSHLLVRCRTSYIPFAKWFAFMNQVRQPDADALAGVERFVRAALIDGTDRRGARVNPLNPLHWFGQTSPDDGPKLLLGSRVFLREACVRCGQCAALCPVGAISMEADGMRCDERRCIGCCGCFNTCPRNAWRSTRFGPEYYNKGRDVAAMAATLRQAAAPRGNAIP